MNIPAGLLMHAALALKELKGTRPIPLAVRITRAQKVLAEYDNEWRANYLNDAIKEFTDGKNSVPDKDARAFIDKYAEIYEMEVEVEGIEPFTMEEFANLSSEGDGAAILLQTGLLVD